MDDKMKCNICGKLAMYTCPTCGGDFCGAHHEHPHGQKVTLW